MEKGSASRLLQKGPEVKTSAKIYIAFVSLAGVLLGIGCCLTFFLPVIRDGAAFSLPLFFIPVLVCALCRSFPIEIRENEVLDLSVISVLAMYLTQGAAVAVSAYMISTLITFESAGQGKKLHHISKIGLQKLFFNDSTIILSIIIPAALIKLLCRWTPGDLSLPGALLPTMLFSVLTFVINGLLQMTMFCLNGMISPGDMAHMMMGLTPNVIAAMPMGLLIGLGYSTESKVWIVFLMLFPLMLARFAWKLYLDSEKARTKLITAFINSIEAKDKYTQGHSERVSEYSTLIARQMKLSRHEVQLIRQGAVLHDIGKIGITDSILNKPSMLTDDEFKIMTTHAEIGVRILEKVGLENEVVEMVHGHHERYDGTGYPQGSKGKDLSLATRILCVADAYDAMTSDRPYRKGMSQEVAVRILREGKGTQFDPEIVDAFVEALEKR